MNLVTDLPQNVSIPSHDRFIAATCARWESHGAAAISARQLSQAADAPVSSIYHHFGSLEHLFFASQQHCLVRAQAWCNDQLLHISGISASGESFAGLFAHVVDEWTTGQRALAFAWRECQLLSERNPMFAPLAEQWSTTWADFWTQAGEALGLGPAHVIAARLFESESLLHLIRWRRVVDRAALDETARTLGAWLSGEAVPPAPWREHARAEALRSLPAPPERDEAAAGIVAAAADLLRTTGVAGVTHRAVAESAGLTLGAVSHKFRTKSALLEAAFEGVYAALTHQLGTDDPIPEDAQSVEDSTVRMILRSTPGSAQDELFVAAARDPGLAPLGAQLRYLRGRSSMAFLQALLGASRKAQIVEAALYSGFISSQLRTYAGAHGNVAAVRLTEEFALLRGLLAPS